LISWASFVWVFCKPALNFWNRFIR